MLTVSMPGDGKSKAQRQYAVPAEAIQTIDGSKYMVLNRTEVFVRRLLTMQARVQKSTHQDEGITNLSLSNIMDRLIKLRKLRIKISVTGSEEAAAQLSKTWCSRKKSRWGRLPCWLRPSPSLHRLLQVWRQYRCQLAANRQVLLLWNSQTQTCLGCRKQSSIGLSKGMFAPCVPRRLVVAM